MLLRKMGFILLLILGGGCTDNKQAAFPSYSAEVFNAKWMAGSINQKTGIFFLVGEQGSIALSREGVHWDYAKTPVSTTLYDIAINTEKNVMMAVGEGATVLRSRDGGRVWKSAAIHFPGSADFKSSRFNKVIYSPKDGVWLAVGTGNAIIRSQDQGETWAVVSYNNGADQLEILDLFIEKKTGDLLLAAQHATSARSSDGGLSWNIVEHDLESGGAYVPHIVGFHQYGDVLIAAADSGRLLVSENSGESWTLQKLPTAGYFTGSAYDPLFQTLVLSTQMGEIALSQDGGKTWHLKKIHVNNWPIEDVPYITDIKYDEQSKSLLATGNSGLLARSEDGGLSWQADIFKPAFSLSQTTLLHDVKRNIFVGAGLGGFIAISEGLGSAREPLKNWQVVRPGIDQYMRQVVHIPDSDSFIIVGQLGGIWRSEDDGLKWNSIPVAYPHSNQPPHLRDVIHHAKTGGLVAAGPAGSILHSADKGKNWTPVFQGAIHKGEAFTQILQDKKRQNLLAIEALYGGVYLSGDGGKDWEKIQTVKSDGRNLWHAAISEVSDKIILVGQKGAISISRDGGKNWANVNSHSYNNLFGAFVDSKEDVFFAVGEHGIILRSEDTVNWKSVNSDTASTLRRMLREPKSGALLAFGQEGTITRSLDGGLSWQTLKTPHSRTELRHALFEPNSNNLILLGSDGVILRSVDSAETWQALESHSHQHFRSGAINPQSGTLIAVGDGLVRLARP